jgi:hypothetical protein
LTKCRRRCSEEQEKVEEDKLRRESGGKYSRRRIPEVFIKIHEQDSFRREVNNSRPSDLQENYAEVGRKVFRHFVGSGSLEVL